MNREVRIVSLAILTLVVYAATQFIYSGVFLFPFPLNELIFLIVSGQFFWWNYTQDVAQYRIILLAAIIHVISTQFFWTFFLDAPKMQWLVNTSYLDILKIGYDICLMVWIYLFLRLIPTKAKYLLLCLTITFIGLSTVFSTPLWEFAAFTSMSFAAFWWKIESKARYLWILLAALRLMTLVALFT